jgi:hypothetical protein
MAALAPIHDAVRWRNVEALRRELERGVDPDLRATETDHPYLQKVIDAGGWANYERLHLDKLTAMLTPPPPPSDGRRRSRRRLSPLRRVPPEVIRRIVAYAFHAGYY